MLLQEWINRYMNFEKYSKPCRDANDVSFCPRCKSKNTHWRFYNKQTDIYIIENIKDIDNIDITIGIESICLDCGYTDEIGGFEKTNQAISRENKINQILDTTTENETE